MAAFPVNVYCARPLLPDVSRVLACLYEKEIEFELVDMHAGQQTHLDFLKLQFHGRAPVPAFEDGSTFLLESRAICRYASEKYQDHGNRYLLGRDLLERGSIEQWLKTEEHSFNPPSLELVFHLAFDPSTSAPSLGLNQPSLVQSEQALAKVLDVYEHRLSESKYLAGDEFTLADLSHLSNSHYIANSKQWCGLFESRKNVLRWWETVSCRPSWAKVVQTMSEFEAGNGSTTKEIVSAPADVSHTGRSSTRALLVPQSSIWLENDPKKTSPKSTAAQSPATSANLSSEAAKSSPSMVSTVKNGSKAPNSKPEPENVAEDKTKSQHGVASSSTASSRVSPSMASTVKNGSKAPNSKPEPENVAEDKTKRQPGIASSSTASSRVNPPASGTTRQAS